VSALCSDSSMIDASPSREEEDAIADADDDVKPVSHSFKLYLSQSFTSRVFPTDL
jgi:hypothetical protein